MSFRLPRLLNWVRQTIGSTAFFTRVCRATQVAVDNFVNDKPKQHSNGKDKGSYEGSQLVLILEKKKQTKKQTNKQRNKLVSGQHVGGP